MKRLMVLAALGAALLGMPERLRAVEPVETPSLAAEVQAGRLPPVAQRLPRVPLVFAGDRPDWRIGRHGGELRMLMARPQDTRMMTVYGYARLVCFDTRFDLVPDILESFAVEEERVFTFRLRPGHRWSDGKPFTTEDFRYYWDDVALNKHLSPVGPPKALVVDGKPGKVEILDEVTIRYSWEKPNPDFLPQLAGASPLYIFRPAHYMRQFHAKYADAAKLADTVKQAGVRNWAALHNRMDNQYRNDNPDLPTLEPWLVETKPPADRFVFSRNPYFHRVDAQGRQLPYVDRVILNIADSRIVRVKTGAGEADLQARYISFSDYTFLRQAAKRNDFGVRLWNTAKGAHLALFPNLNVKDPVWRQLFRDLRFRRALSVAINRHEINQVVYFGLAVEGANTVLAESPLYRPEYRQAWAQFDLKLADRLLDDIGLTRRDSRGVRLLPDGRPMEIIVETAGEETEQTDVLALIHDSWLAAGIKLFSRPSQREVFRNRVFAGETMVSIWQGLENGLPTALMSPEELAPVTQQQLQWPKWGQHAETRGQSGEPPDLPEAKELLQLFQAWRGSESRAERERIWHRMLAIQAEQVYGIGLIAGVKQPIVIANALRNVPEKGVFNWDPGAFFGIYRMESFWWDRPGTTAAAR